MKLQSVRIKTNDFPKDQREFVDALGGILNPFIDKLVIGFNKNFTVDDNLPFEFKTIEVTVDIFGNPTLIPSTGTVSQLASTVTGVGTSFSVSMVGATLRYANGVSAGVITAVASPTSLTVSTSQTVTPAQAYSILTVQPYTILTNLTNLKGYVCVNATDLSGGQNYPTSTPFIVFSLSSKTVTVNKITGLTANKTYRLVLLGIS
jgi:hypothetical protein